MGDVVQLRDYQPKHDLARLAELERQAVEIMNVALMGEPGMCGMEPVIYVEILYTAPDKDSA